jgi:hypothetical protein
MALEEKLSTQPTGVEREVRPVSRVSIDGAPVTYIVVLAAVAAALAFVPFSPIFGLGTSFPLSQGVFPLIGWLLGPVGGALASGIGRFAGAFLAPLTAGPIPLISAWSAAVGGFAAGAMAPRAGRKWWWIPLTGVFLAMWLALVARAVLVNGVSLSIALMYTFINWSSILLFMLPTRVLFARWIEGDNLLLLSLGLFFGTWMIAGIAHLAASSPYYFIYNLPAEVMLTVIPAAPVENAFRALIGAVIGVGVITGLRAIGLVKPTQATY